MNSYLVILKNKRKGELSNDLLIRHVTYLKKLSKQGSLKLCGPFADNDGALMIYLAESIEEVEKLLNNDPFICDKYYQAYKIKEFIEANEENNWLMGGEQIQENLKD